MSWLSSWLDKQGGIGKGLNAVGGPLVNVAGSITRKIPGIGTAQELLEKYGGMVPGGGAPAQPALPGGLTMADILKTLGSVGGGIADYAGQEATRKQAGQQFDKTMGQRREEFSTTQLPGIQQRLDRAPLVDRGQYLMANRAAPTAFKPRDFTRGGLGVMGQQATGGPAEQLAANAQAAANYRPGMGGVDTNTLELLKKRMLAGAS